MLNSRHAGPLVFLLDVDNTLLDNDRIEEDLKDHLEREFGSDCRQRYWKIFEELRVQLGYADYLGALQRYRLRDLNDPRLLLMSSFLVDYPFRIVCIRQFSMSSAISANLPDRHSFRRRRRVPAAQGATLGPLGRGRGRVLIYVHKEQMLDDVARHYPARHYVMVDDKLRILQAMKQVLGDRLTTVFPRQGHYALDAGNTRRYAPADITVESIAGLLGRDFSTMFGAAAPAAPSPVRQE